jgi:catechol 2,3-dioxygenase-like lactoylglutathione lyase family enzyme
MRHAGRSPPGAIAVQEGRLTRLAIQSPHDGDGELHLAFAIPAPELANWEAWLTENEIAVAEKRTWEFGGQSLYFRDPDRHLIEVATPGVWSIY